MRQPGYERVALIDGLSLSSGGDRMRNLKIWFLFKWRAEKTALQEVKYV